MKASASCVVGFSRRALMVEIALAHTARAPRRDTATQLNRQLRRRSLLAVIIGIGALLAGAMACGRSAARSAAPEKLAIFAAASLRDVFSVMARDFERSHPDVEITFNFAGSQELRSQLEHGAPADVFASADQRHMSDLVRAGRAADPVLFARNEPVLVVARESAGAVRSLGDLPRVERIVIGAPEVPIGKYTLEILERARATLGADFRARVEARIVSRELNVRQVLTKVALGEAQAALVYRTDARAAGDRVGVVSIPSDINVVAEYPIAILTDAAHPRVARAWVDFVLSPAGQRALSSAGFGAAGMDPAP